MPDDLIHRLRALARAEHDDLSVAAEAADEIQALREESDGWEAVSDMQAEDIESLQRANEHLESLYRATERHPYPAPEDSS